MKINSIHKYKYLKLLIFGILTKQTIQKQTNYSEISYEYQQYKSNNLQQNFKDELLQPSQKSKYQTTLQYHIEIMDNCDFYYNAETKYYYKDLYEYDLKNHAYLIPIYLGENPEDDKIIDDREKKTLRGLPDDVVVTFIACDLTSINNKKLMIDLEVYYNNKFYEYNAAINDIIYDKTFTITHEDFNLLKQQVYSDLIKIIPTDARIILKDDVMITSKIIYNDNLVVIANTSSLNLLLILITIVITLSILIVGYYIKNYTCCINSNSENVESDINNFICCSRLTKNSNSENNSSNDTDYSPGKSVIPTNEPTLAHQLGCNVSESVLDSNESSSPINRSFNEKCKD